MAFFNWDENFSVHIQEFDAHHKQLISLCNELYEKVFECEDLDEERALTQEILHQFVVYINYHFRAEEELMVKLGYPNYQEHKQKHDECIKEVEKIETEHREGGVALSFTAFMFLKEWISIHILGTDKEYEQFFHERNIG